MPPKQIRFEFFIFSYEKPFSSNSESGIRQRIIPKSYFGYPFTKISLQDSDAKTRHSIKNLTPHYNSQFFPCFILCFCVETLRCLETCLNFVSTYLFIFLNLFSKAPGGLRPRATLN